MISQLKFFLKNLFELLSQAPKKKIFTVYFLLIVQSLLDTIGIGLVGPVIAAILDINLLIDNIPVDSLKEYFLSLTKNQIIFWRLSFKINFKFIDSNYIGKHIFENWGKIFKYFNQFLFFI